MFGRIRKHFYSKASQRDARPEIDRWYPTPVEVPKADPTEREKIDRILEFLKTDSAFADERTYGVDRKDHEQQCLLLLAKCFGVICLLKIRANSPMGFEERDHLKALMSALWTERRAEVKALIPIWQETTPGVH